MTNEHLTNDSSGRSKDEDAANAKAGTRVTRLYIHFHPNKKIRARRV
jgi:hypothetical protein